jgi:hypothetical protein
MTPLRKFLIFNVAAVLGLVVSLFIVPGNTPFWLWGVIAIVVVAGLNVSLALKRQGNRPDSKATIRTAIIGLGAALLVIDIILSRYFR